MVVIIESTEIGGKMNDECGTRKTEKVGVGNREKEESTGQKMTEKVCSRKKKFRNLFSSLPISIYMYTSTMRSS